MLVLAGQGLRVFLMAGLRGPSSDQSFAIPAVVRGLGRLWNWGFAER